jgi:hypothetical protein
MSQIKTIDSYFKPLTREQKERRTLRMEQSHRRQKEHRLWATSNIVDLAASAMNIIDHSNNIDEVNHADQPSQLADVGDFVQNAFQEILVPSLVKLTKVVYVKYKFGGAFENKTK